MGHILENVVFLELFRRGYEVYIGKVGRTEIDFIAMGDQGEAYYQVASTVTDPSGAAGPLFHGFSVCLQWPSYGKYKAVWVH